MKLQPPLIALTALLVLLTAFTCAVAADPPVLTAAPPAAITPEILNAKIKEVAAGDLDETTKSALTELYRKALSELERTRSHAAAAEAYIQARTGAPEQAKEIRKKLERVEAESPTESLELSEQTPLAVIEQMLLKEKADLTAVEAKLAELNKQLELEAERPSAVRQRLTEAKQRQEALAAEFKLPVSPEELPALTEAKRWVAESESLALSAEIRMLDQELLSQPMRIELLNAERDKSAHSVKWVGTRVKVLEETVNQRRRAEAEQAQAEAEAARRKSVGEHPLVQELAEQNAATSEELLWLAADLESATTEENLARERVKRIEEDFAGAKQKLQVAGLSQALGQVLLEQRRSLPDPRIFRKRVRDREELVAASGLRQIQHNEERRRLRDTDAYVTKLTAELPAEEAAAIRDELENLVRSRRELLDKAIAADDSYLRVLGELDFTQRRLLEVTEAYDEFLAEHLLWIRSTSPINLTALWVLPEEVVRLVSPAGWQEVFEVLAYQANTSPILAMVVLLFGTLMWNSKRIHRALIATGRSVGRPTKDRLGFTFQAFGLTLLLAAPWPLLLAAMGWQMQASLEATDFSKAMGFALLSVAQRFYFLRAFRVLVVRNGLAEMHFRWSASSLRLLRRQLDWLMLVFLPSAFIALASASLDPTALGGALGKLAFVALVSALVVFLYRVLHPRHGALQSFLIRHRASALFRFRHLWFPFVVGLPLVLAALALAGYLYTAATLTRRLVDTMWLVFSLVVVGQVVERWLFVTRRRLAYNAALERREAGRAAAKAEESHPLGEELLEVEEPELDLNALSDDSRKLMNTGLVFGGIIGLWLIWSPVLPAFGILDDVSLWHYTAVVEGQQERVPITLADAALAIIIAVAAVVAAKRLPALLEIGLLQRFEMSSGGRYAVTTLSSYAIAAIGIILFFNTIGASWSQIQWLVAALGVGIGFGLQEIVANFISGLIILFERPIRVGDIVTVGDTDGVVTRIRIRATTIRNWDRKELLVPNKEFITGRVLNWSLSDQVTRIVIVVGVAYGSNVERALSLMTEAAEENEHVLEDPEPFVTFEGFGDNSLSLLLRCHIGSLDYRLSTISALHKAINKKFSEAGIVIAFPQRDLHLDSSRPLDIRIQRGNGQSNPGGNAQGSPD